MQNKPSELCTKEEIKVKLATIVPLRIIGVPRTFPKGQTSLLTIIKARQEAHQTTTPNTTRPMHHDGCKTWPYQWILAVQEPPTMDKEDKETLEEEGVNMANTTINPPTTFKTMP